MRTRMTVLAAVMGVVGWAGLGSAKGVVVLGCDWAARQEAHVVAVLDDEALADHPEFESIVREALFWAVADPNFPGPDSYVAFEARLEPYAPDIWDALTSLSLVYTGRSCS